MLLFFKFHEKLIAIHGLIMNFRNDKDSLLELFTREHSSKCVVLGDGVQRLPDKRDKDCKASPPHGIFIEQHRVSSTHRIAQGVSILQVNA